MIPAVPFGDAGRVHAPMKSQTPSATATGISIAPTASISGIAKLGSVSAARSWPASSSAGQHAVLVGIERGELTREDTAAASARVGEPFASLSWPAMSRSAAAFGRISSPEAECA